MNRYFLTLIAVVLLAVTSAAQQPMAALFSSDTLMVMLPFTDNSEFNGKWDLSMDVPRFASAYMRERFHVGAIPPTEVRSFALAQGLDTLQLQRTEALGRIAQRFRARFLVVADIQEFSIGRFMVKEVQLAGYESFTAEVKLRFTIYDASHFGSSRSPVVDEGDAIGSVKDRGLGLTLFGKQSDRTNEYFMLDEVAFGSETFNGTIIGDALLRCMDDLAVKLERAVPSLVSRSVVLSSSVVIDTSDNGIALKRKLVNGSVVMVDEDDVFIDLGSKDGVAVGDVMPVFGPLQPVKDPSTGMLLGDREQRMGELQVIEVRAEHLSLTTILSGKGSIAPKQRVRKVFVR